MSAVADTFATRVRISDPKPAYCSGCGQGAQGNVRFVDFDAAHDSGVVMNQDGAVLVGQDDLHLCEACVRAGAEALGLKPELHSKQVQLIRQLERERDHWKDYAKKFETTVAERPVPAKRGRRG